MYRNILVVIYTLSALCAAHAANTPSAPQMQLIEKAVKSKLKDPYSAKLSNVLVAKNLDPEIKGKLMACGLVNAKNSYGGYVGNKPFMGVFYDERFIVFGSSFEQQPSKEMEVFVLQQVIESCGKSGIALISQ
jgi:hypothetical protein